MARVTKLRAHFSILPAATAVFLLLSCSDFKAQDTPSVVKKWEEYQKQANDDSSKQMVELKKAIPRLLYDLRYASTNNFMHRIMYVPPPQVSFLRAPAVTALQKVQRALAKKGMGLKVFDAYRPYSVTVLFWELVKDERYVANPAKGSGHNRGIAVDLTIINLRDSTELDMGTGFDNFSDSAHHSFSNLPNKILQNRKLLRSLMEQNGFKALETEWWHYSLPDAETFELMDVNFESLFAGSR